MATQDLRNKIAKALAPKKEEASQEYEEGDALNGLLEMRHGLAGVDDMHADNPAKRVRERVMFGIERGGLHSQLRDDQAARYERRRR